MSNHDANLNLIFQALSDPTRREMLLRLGRGAMPVTELARPTGLRLPTVMRHLSVLEEAGLITTHKEGRTRTCEMRPMGLGVARDWLAERRADWEALTDRLEAFLEQMDDEDEIESGD